MVIGLWYTPQTRTLLSTASEYQGIAMSGPSPVAISVSPHQRAVLERLLRQHSTPQAIARRISIALAAADGEGNDPLAARLATSPNTIRRWRARWAHAQPEL